MTKAIIRPLLMCVNIFFDLKEKWYILDFSLSFIILASETDGDQFDDSK